MKRTMLTVLTGWVIIGAPIAGADYGLGEIIVEFADGVELEPPPGVPDGRYPELDALGMQYGVYESVPVFDLPTEPVAHPGGLWTWEDWQDMVGEERLAYFFVLKYTALDDPADVADDYAACNLVEYAEPDYIGECYFLPNDPHFDDQWYLYYPQNRDCDIHAPEGWDKFIFAPPERTRKGRGGDAFKPIVAVVDSGIWMSGPSYNQVHADIKANVIQGRDIIDEDDYPEDIYGHGTAIAGIAGAVWHNNLGIAGIGKNDTYIMPIRITHTMSERLELFVKAAAGGIVWALSHGADVINMSWGFPEYVIPRTVQRAIEGAWRLDINTVAAAGNSGGRYSTYPASEGRQLMISVAGTKRMPYDWERWEGSSWPPDGATIAAPSWPNIYVTWLNNGYKSNENGTSYSSPIVAATVAGYRHMLASFGDPYAGVDYDALYCVEASGADYPYNYNEKTGYGTTYYDEGLDHAIEIRPGGDGGGERSEATAPAVEITATASFPSPASEAATFRVEVGRTNVREATFAVYDLSGRKIREANAPVAEAAAEFAWDLTAANGTRVPPGVYLWRVEVGPASAAKKCVVN